MKIKANRERCTGHARCAAVAPEVFTLDDDGFTDLTTENVPDALAEAARRGVRACPERALSIVDDAT